MEKKLTDEEFVKALKHKKKIILEEVNRTNNCLDDLIVCVDAELIVEALDLIHRLQDENKRLKDENIEERDIHFKNLCQYKDEIARLQKQVDELMQANIDLWNANQCGVKFAKNPYKGVEVE